MKITRRCPICDRVNTMNISKELLENNNRNLIGAKKWNFYKYGYCATCQKSIKAAKKEGALYG